MLTIRNLTLAAAVTLATTTAAAAQTGYRGDMGYNSGGTDGYNSPTLRLDTNRYGLGAGSDQYGRPFRHNPTLELRQNQYGPGIHSDQYGRPLTLQGEGQNRGLTRWRCTRC